MIKIVTQLLLNASPVILAAIFHMFIVKMNYFSWMTYPLDHHKMYNGKPVFGPNKTYRGLVVMIVAAVFFSFIYSILLTKNVNLQEYDLLHITTANFVFYGVLFGFGYVIGELPNSFHKRQAGVAAGKANTVVMHIIDQVDSVFTVMLLLVFFSSFTWMHFGIGVFFYGFIHIAINYLLYLVGLRKEAF